ncbi:ubiquinol-cytochrome c reductase cytochrome c1 subunit [Monoraphidium neglectum]|uniref:Ubiquinol-cytochrome c reductase cytochrome c1 subunit n=1 Tax=Monoraphidium neglectum TaxID=145388 RepID=A0A0D2N0A6_9CHLO|nr:ubiquinol-cytochrome c reductase cytochrome c1 subunit [Monoraphidium neglectum]KIY99740.1 ubiquinol-cytochrome c reductase cytochrome c1 subunit [Monoraphidium neglectum]|eukprot:XP_013898760.1 ubiquinol-cytochrome c reductase cytochrome c1 subunit [Monoraphidium neglectum]
MTTAAAADHEGEHGLDAGSWPWSHSGLLDSYDHASIRRGYQVYKQVCAACHSMQYIHFRDLVGVAYTEEEAKAMAAEEEVIDGPNDEGEMYERPGRLSDGLPAPYANEQASRRRIPQEGGGGRRPLPGLRRAARYSNGGAYPPDLSLICTARPNGTNYVFALLLGYKEPPAGISVREGLYYNPYFPGGAIAMPRMLNDGGVEYDDGTPSSSSQQAKDVTTFLAWAASPEHDERKLVGVKALTIIGIMWAFAVYQKRLKWAPLKSRRVVLDVVN